MAASERPDDRASPALPGTVPLADSDPIDRDGLQTFLRAASLLADNAAWEVRRYPGGHSNLTYAVAVDDVPAFVLRAPPPGAHTVSGHDMLREHDLLAALHPHYPKAPKPLAVCRVADTSPLRAPFYVMAHQPGLILRHKPPKDRVIDDAAMATITGSLVDELAAIHAVDVDDALAGFGKADGPLAYVQRQVDGWCARYEKARTDEISDIEALMTWLKAHVPAAASGPATVVHNDFKLDNLVLDDAAPHAVRAVLDWELCTIGEPLTDLGTTLAYWVEHDDGDDVKALPMGLTHLPGALRRQDVVDRWAEKTGRSVDDVLFYYLLACFKVAVIAQQIYARYARGFTSDPRFASLGFAVAVIGARAQRALDAGTIRAH